MARTASISARTGRFVTTSVARRNPRTTSTERIGQGSFKAVYRSTITGHFVTGSTARRHPVTTISQEL